MVEIEHLTKRFGTFTAVDDVSFALAKGEVLGFLGPNGAGKSTTMRMITGFLTPDAGTVRVGGDDVSADPVAAKRRIGYLPEGAPLYGDMTPRTFLRFIAEIRGFRGRDRDRAVEAVVDKVHLAPALEKPIDTLSKGFKRRVGLAQAIIHDPEVLILDEPTDGLDPNQKHEVRTLIRSMSQDKAIILSTHILEEVEAVCSRAIIISAGRVVSDSTPEELVARSGRHNAISVSIRTDRAENIERELGELAGVESVRLIGRENGIARLEVYPRENESLAAPVSELARERGWAVEELIVERGRLDEVFREVTAGRGSIS
ncbi:MAG: ATP-binding cassette domain-containing protein [Gammaproteobacteria bacterium]|nr:ATP-binding cassette domain-containing protein [Gammaproteobacteria bacterium]